jgi:hypothetical protein
MAEAPAGAPLSLRGVPWSPSGPGLRAPFWVWVALWHVAGVGGAVALHLRMHHAASGWYLALAPFLVTNLLITTWEMALARHIGDLERWHAEGRGFGDPSELFALRVSAREAFSSGVGALVWLAYSRFDPGYADRRSFGFAVDVGNGVSTPLPTLLFLVGMSVPILPPLALGVVGILLFYQKLYGTLLYFAQFAWNRRHVGHPTGMLLAYVVATNGVWVVFPLLGMWVSLRLIVERSFTVLGG